MHMREIPLDLITLPPDLHREVLDAAALERLARSIEQVGLLNAITVEATGDHYLLRAGHRRYEAHRLLRRTSIMAQVRDPGELGHGEVITWIENLEREDLTPLEQARACRRMIDTRGLTARKVAELLRRSPQWVDDRLDLLDTPTELQALVHKAELPMRHALELARVTDPAHREHLTRYALLSGASFTVIKDWVAQWRLHAETASGVPAPLPPLPLDGQRAIVLIPCLTCGEARPPHELRVAHICIGCHQVVIDATAEWRQPHQQHSSPLAAGQGSTLRDDPPTLDRRNPEFPAGDTRE
jgi:ParB/RepB/Spo0J family partition protein